ncbi:MAG: hypothetical protein K1X64_04265 [Myxococcaceae bacterium]|nr:hypothetical protein [Myxococcaceae bacterium]
MAAKEPVISDPELTPNFGEPRHVEDEELREAALMTTKGEGGEGGYDEENDDDDEEEHDDDDDEDDEEREPALERHGHRAAKNASHGRPDFGR